jgi:hypothetical protein
MKLDGRDADGASVGPRHEHADLLSIGPGVTMECVLGRRRQRLTQQSFEHGLAYTVDAGIAQTRRRAQHWRVK